MDNLFLTGPSGTTLNVGSWLRPYDKPDYGSKSLLLQAYSENPFAEGGVLAYEHLGVRHMSLPVIMPSVAAFGGLAALEGMFRLIARPGAVLDVQPQGVSDAIRFDVIGGRYEEDYDTYENTVMRRKGTIYLDTQPLGYLPTSILVASTASIAVPGSLDLSAVSFIGDAPGLAELVVQPKMATAFGNTGTWLPDAVFWSLGGRASMTPWWSTASMTSVDLTSSGTANAFAYGGSMMRIDVSPATAAWTAGPRIIIPTSLEPAYRGRFRVFALARLNPSMAGIWGMGVDAVGTLNYGQAFASAAAVGTIQSTATPAFGVVDCGEVTLPPAASGLAQSVHLRTWFGITASQGMASSPRVDLAGLYLHSLDGANGFLANGLYSRLPFGGVPTPNQFAAQSYERRVTSNQPVTDLSVRSPVNDVIGNHRGGLPMVAQASTSHLDVLIGGRSVAVDTGPLFDSSHFSAAVSLSYRPRFFFLHGL